MPNHVKNRIEIIGTPEQVKSVIDKFSTLHPEALNKTHDEKLIICKHKEGSFIGWYDPIENEFEYSKKGIQKVKGLPAGIEYEYTKEFIQFPDFDKVIPRPKSLDITSDKWLMPLENRFAEHATFKAHLEEIKEHRKQHPEGENKRVENFITGIRNYIEYGHATWCGWSIENWGTKWNSYSCEREADNIFTFETAWSSVPAIIEEMSKHFPGVMFVYEWSDEDTGCNCGSGTFVDGVGNVIKFVNTSEQAYEMAFKLRPELKENYKKVGGKYEYVE